MLPHHGASMVKPMKSTATAAILLAGLVLASPAFAD
jgi:hypothetical protein